MSGANLKGVRLSASPGAELVVGAHDRMKILVAPDKFKGTLTAQAASHAIVRGWRRVRPFDECVVLPISDGGDGFGAVLAKLCGAMPVRTTTVDAAGRRCVVSWWWDAGKRTAIIESARVIGLAMLPRGKFHPFELDTSGLAEVFRAVTRRGARRCLVGIGGSATNDGGFGLARGLGWRFLDHRGQPIERWTELNRLERLERPRERVCPKNMVVAVDVQNRLLGARGCTRIYGPQKGLRPGDFAMAEAALRQLAKVVRADLGADLSVQPGSGAAGGLGFGLAAFAEAALEPGFDLVAAAASLEKKIHRADIVITGEGRVDRSTLMGKGVGELAARCRRLNVPCIVLAGGVTDRAALERKFFRVGAMTDLATPDRAQREAKVWLERLAVRVATNCFTT